MLAGGVFAGIPWQVCAGQRQGWKQAGFKASILMQARGCGLGQAGGGGHKEKELKSAAASRVELRVG